MTRHVRPPTSTLALPPIPNLQAYVGLYVFDFGTHVSVGYTPGEVWTLRETPEHRSAAAYEIYRVDDSGAIELRGAIDERLTAREAVCFLRASGAAARRDYDALRATAERTPVPCAVEMQLARLPVFSPPDVTALHYAAGASTAMSRWLLQCAGGLGDRTVGGADVHRDLVSERGLRMATCVLRARIEYADRPLEQLLAGIDRAIQR